PHDGKTQVTLKNGKITSIVASFQHAKSNELKDAISEWLRSESIVGTVNNLEFHCNPAGDWTQGGFDADAGLTGRKLVVDNYGPRIPIGGGAFSGKDPSKVDRSAAYMARYIARQYLKNHNAKEVFVHIAYAIGYSQPLEATVTINGKQAPILDYDLSPNAIIAKLNLRQPIYEQTARWGHFGHAEFPWEV
ncbi:methionine adenosyltransferase domain-containing protein, partial [Candidatus Saccharibacteria bacterium]|nr:methionine adenosyltransferase domain-containing protein [Candidatus Saccharibacteria bacterium]